MAGLATSGTLTHWFANRFARDLDAQSPMAALAEEAEASSPGGNGLLVLPYFSGERTPIHDPHAKGAILGLTLASTRADLYRALIEGIAFAINHIFETCAEADPPPGTIQAIGGGVRNRVWTQATSDVSGYAQVVRKVAIGAAYGDAFLAALAVGDVSREAIKTSNPALRGSSPIRRTPPSTGAATTCSARSTGAPKTSWRRWASVGMRWGI
jgi:xylulokinase